MLVSPLMVSIDEVRLNVDIHPFSPFQGPILAAVFGTVIKDRNLQMLGIRNETIAIGLVLLSGFFFGLIISSTDEKWGLGEGVTEEMLARCQPHSLKLGIAIALPSGAAVAVAILAENGGGLVGVAISASLLPPSVNAVRSIFDGLN